MAFRLKRYYMENDDDRLLLVPLRERTKAQVDVCTDANLLDLIMKLLITAK